MADTIIVTGGSSTPQVPSPLIDIGSGTPREFGTPVGTGLQGVTADGSTLFIELAVSDSINSQGDTAPSGSIEVRADDFVSWNPVTLTTMNRTAYENWPRRIVLGEVDNPSFNRVVLLAKGPAGGLALVSPDRSSLYLTYLRVRQMKGVTADHATTDAIEGIIDSHVKEYAQDGGRDISLGDILETDRNKIEDAVNLDSTSYTESSGTLQLVDNESDTKNLQIGRAFTDAEKRKLASMEQGAKDDMTPQEIRDELQSLQGNDRLDASAVKGVATTAGFLPLLNTYETQLDAHRFEEALRKETSLVSNVPVNFQGNGLAQQINGNPKVPSGDFDREFEVKVGSGVWHRFTNSDLLAKTETTPPSTMDDLSSLSYTEGGVTYRIGRHVTDDEFLVSSSQDGTQNVSIRDVPINIDKSLVPDAGLSEQEVQNLIDQNPSSELEVVAALPAVLSKDVGTIVNYQGDLWEVVDNTKDSNLISGISNLQGGYYGQAGLFQWQSVHPYNIRVDLSKAGLGATPPGTLYAEFNSGRTTDFITLARSQGSDTSTTYHYVHAPGSAGIEDTVTGAFNVRFFRTFQNGQLGSPVTVHASKRWELDERGQHTPVNERLAITELAEGPGTGITVTSAGQVKRNALSGFNPAFNLQDANNRSGILEVEFRLDISTRAPNSVGFDQAGGTQAIVTGWTHSSSVLSASAYSGSSDEGIEIGSQEVYNGSTELGSLKLFLAKDGSNQLGYYLSYAPSGGTSSQNFAVSLRLNAEFYHNDAPASSGGTLGGVNVTVNPDNEVNITSVNGATSAWQNIIALPAITAEQSGPLVIIGEVHGEASGTPTGGGDRVITESRIRKRTAAGVVSSVSSHNDYGPRNIQGGNAQTSTDFQNKSQVSDEELVAIIQAAEGDTYTLQARVTGQKPNESQTMDFNATQNSPDDLQVRRSARTCRRERTPGIEGRQGGQRRQGRSGKSWTSGESRRDRRQGSQGRQRRQGRHRGRQHGSRASGTGRSSRSRRACGFVSGENVGVDFAGSFWCEPVNH